MRNVLATYISFITLNVKKVYMLQQEIHLLVHIDLDMHCVRTTYEESTS